MLHRGMFPCWIAEKQTYLVDNNTSVMVWTPWDYYSKGIRYLSQTCKPSGGKKNTPDQSSV